MINMTFKGLTEELSRTLISEKMQLQGYLGAQLPFAGSTFKKKKKTAKAAAPESFPKWEEEADMDEVPEASMQQVSPSAGGRRKGRISKKRPVCRKAGRR